MLVPIEHGFTTPHEFQIGQVSRTDNCPENGATLVAVLVAVCRVLSCDSLHRGARTQEIYVSACQQLMRCSAAACNPVQCSDNRT